MLQSVELSHDLLFLLGASQHLSNVLIQQEQDWETVFLTDRGAAKKSTAAHLQACRSSLLCDLPEDDFYAGCAPTAIANIYRLERETCSLALLSKRQPRI